MNTGPKHMCMHCKRAFVFNDELRYFAHKRVDSLPCDICEETNYLIKDKSKTFLLTLSILAGCLALIPLSGSAWLTYDMLSSGQRTRVFILTTILFIGFIMTTSALNVIYKNYIWQTHKFSKQFHSPFLDNLNRQSHDSRK